MFVRNNGPLDLLFVQDPKRTRSQFATFHCLCSLLLGNNICHRPACRTCKTIKDPQKSLFSAYLKVCNKNALFAIFCDKKPICDVPLSLQSSLSLATAFVTGLAKLANPSRIPKNYCSGHVSKICNRNALLASFLR